MHGLHTKVLLNIILRIHSLPAAWGTDPPTIQFLITHSKQKWKGEAWSFLYPMNDITIYLGRQREEASEQGLFFFCS